MGAPTYKLLSSLIAPAKPAEKSYDQIVEALKKHYCLKTVAIVQRFKTVEGGSWEKACQDLVAWRTRAIMVPR